MIISVTPGQRRSDRIFLLWLSLVTFVVNAVFTGWLFFQFSQRIGFLEKRVHSLLIQDRGLNVQR
jgi:hypothetical protein